MKTVLIVGAGPSQAPGIVKAKEMGLRVIATDGSRSAPGLALADESHVVDVRDAEATLRLARRYSVDGVLAIASDVSVRTVAHVAAQMGLPGISERTATRCTDKELQRQAFAAAGLTQPDVRIIAPGDETSGGVAFPAVVKPADSAGSRGVRYVTAPDELRPAIDDARAFSRSEKVLIEEFVEGPERSVEAFVVDGAPHILALSDKIRTQPPFLLDTEVAFPSAMPEADLRALREAGIQAIRAVGIESGPVHLEVIMSPAGPVPVEVAARGPGFKVFTDILPYVSGVDVLAATIAAALGARPDVTPRREAGAILRFLSPPPGRVVGIRGLDEARAVEHVHEVEVYVAVGDTVVDTSCGDERVGHVITLAPTRAEATAAADRAERNLSIDTERAA